MTLLAESTPIALLCVSLGLYHFAISVWAALQINRSGFEAFPPSSSAWRSSFGRVERDRSDRSDRSDRGDLRAAMRRRAAFWTGTL